MKLDPGFTNHWKTERLIDQLGAEAVIAVLRLWGTAQIRRKFSGLELNAKRLAMETKWKGDADKLFSILTDPDAPWIDAEPDGTFTLHGFEEHQHQVVKLWENGKKGGRPKKVSPTPSSKDSSSSSSTSSSSSSSSSPICEPNGNQMVSDNSELFQQEPAQEKHLPSNWKRMSEKDRKQIRVKFNTPEMAVIGSWFGRKPDTLWTISEAVSLDTINPKTNEVDGMGQYYTADLPKDRIPGRRTDLSTLLNNWNGELDRARKFVTEQTSKPQTNGKTTSAAQYGI